MRGKRFSEEQIIGILKKAEARVPVTEITRKHGVADGTFLPLESQVWRFRYQ